MLSLARHQTRQAHMRIIKIASATANFMSLASSRTTIPNRLKESWLGAIPVLVTGLLLQSGLAAAQNLVTNPGFETGDASGWFAWGPDTISAETNDVQSGNYAVLVTNRTDT